MPNTLITPEQITRAASVILHQKCQFVGSINQQYSNEWKAKGATLGATVNVHLNNEYTVQDDNLDLSSAIQTTVETSIPLTLNKSSSAGMDFSSEDLTLNLKDFSTRIIEPAVTRIAAKIESRCLALAKNATYNVVDNDAAAFDFETTFLQGRQRACEVLFPEDNRTAILSPAHYSKLLANNVSLFNPVNQQGKAFRDGVVGTVASFDVMESSFIGDHTTGTAAKTTGYVVNGATQTGAAITVQTGTTTFLVGDVITFAGCNRVHPETKVSTGQLQQFVITANSGASATSLAISPAIVTSGAYQNVSASPTNGGAVVKVAAGASELMNSSLMFQKNAFLFASADLILPNNAEMASRSVHEGFSVAFVREFDVKTRKFISRLDVLWGFAAYRPELSIRLHADA